MGIIIYIPQLLQLQYDFYSFEFDMFTGCIKEANNLKFKFQILNN